MKFKTFAAFVGPSLALMLVFIAAPLIGVLWQSFHLTQPIFENVEVESCTPTFTGQVCTTEIKTRPVLDANGRTVTETTYVGLQSYRNVLEPDRLREAIANDRWLDILNIDFWAALRFTLTFTLITLPLILLFGLGIALAVNNAVRSIRGPIIFVSLLPFIITPVIGALSIRGLFIGDGIMTAFLEWWLGRDIAMFAQAWTIELLMLFYRVWARRPLRLPWCSTPVSRPSHMDTLESAIIDGASRWERLRYVVIPAPDAAHRLRRPHPPDGRLPGVRGDRRLLQPGPRDLPAVAHL